jgi:short-subunit dehydrogenase/acyl dehydratase
MTELRRFSDFKSGDFVTFVKTFEKGDFEGFTSLSGDRNPLHWDDTYAAESEIGKTIVPLHMTMAPLSMIAGVIFPGDPSLYLGHEVRSITPVFYGDELRYSAKIKSINPALRMLIIRVIVSRRTDVVLDANMRVQSRLNAWPAPAETIAQSGKPKRALVTGASGEIGKAMALVLVKRGWNLLLQDRGTASKRETLQQAIEPLLAGGQSVHYVGADLQRPEDLASLCKTVTDLDDIALVLHVASPPTDASIEDLVQINYTALKHLSTAAVPAMLARQEGAIVSLNSIATERVIPGWSDYSAAKAMAAQYVSSVHKTYHGVGINGLTILAGLVATAYSEQYRGDMPAMLPQELAETALRRALDNQVGGAIVVEWNAERSGLIGFHEPAAINRSPEARQVATAVASVADPSASPSPNLGTDLSFGIGEIVRLRLGLADQSHLVGGGLGATPGWDSLRHIEIVLDLEEKLGIRFGSGDMEKMSTFSDLLTISASRLSEAKNGRSA